MVNEPTTLAYLTALMPCAEDHIINNDTLKPDKTPQELEVGSPEKTSPELQDNPYQRPAKRLKTTNQNN